ncbi:MAG: hypothetical protein V1891_04170 [bacterium]
MHKFKNINHNLEIMSECPICKSKGIDLNIVEECLEQCVLHSKCNKCNNAIIMIAVNNDMGINIVGMNTDLSIDEFIKFRSYGKPIEMDDIIELHKKAALKKFINELFENKTNLIR